MKKYGIEWRAHPDNPRARMFAGWREWNVFKWYKTQKARDEGLKRLQSKSHRTFWGRPAWEYRAVDR